MRAFKWGTIKRVSLRGMKTARGKSYKFWKTHFLLSKVWSLELCPLAILMPLEENPYIVHHLKALDSGQKIWGGQSCGSSLSLWNALMKISILLYKMASDWFYVILAVFFCLFMSDFKKEYSTDNSIFYISLLQRPKTFWPREKSTLHQIIHSRPKGN